MKNLLKNGSKSLFDKVLSPTKEKEKNLENVKDKPILMTHRQLTDPFGSDEEDEQMLRDGNGKSDDEGLGTPNLHPETASVRIKIKILEFFEIVFRFLLRTFDPFLHQNPTLIHLVILNYSQIFF